MVAETVLIDVQANIPDGELGQALVTAEFHMLNLGDTSETLDVRFPINANDGFSEYPEIRDLRVFVDGSPVSTSIPPAAEELKWAHFEVSFPPGQEVLIEVVYTLSATGEYPFVAYYYLLETGAGWKDTIGSADLIVRLPYEANQHNVFIDSSPGWGQTSSGAQLVGNEIRWHYDELEPEYQHNLSVALVLPSAWQRVLTERQNVTDDPQDGEAWGRLGKIYKEIALMRRYIRQDPGGMELYDLSVDAYEKAVTLLPDDALWHAGFGELLFSRYYWEEYQSGGSPRTNLLRALEEFHLAYSLDPDNPIILEMLDEAYYGMDALDRHDDGYTFLWLTSTPTIVPTRTASATMTPTQSPAETDAPPAPPPSATATSPPADDPPTSQIPSPTSAPPPEPEPGPSLLPCGSALAVPLMVSVFYLSSKKK
jgi:tetratricopeptide (TPR) repeat protein